MFPSQVLRLSCLGAVCCLVGSSRAEQIEVRVVLPSYVQEAEKVDARTKLAAFLGPEAPFWDFVAAPTANVYALQFEAREAANSDWILDINLIHPTTGVDARKGAWPDPVLLSAGDAGSSGLPGRFQWPDKIIDSIEDDILKAHPGKLVELLAHVPICTKLDADPDGGALTAVLPLPTPRFAALEISSFLLRFQNVQNRYVESVGLKCIGAVGIRIRHEGYLSPELERLNQHLEDLDPKQLIQAHLYKRRDPPITASGAPTSNTDPNALLVSP